MNKVKLLSLSRKVCFEANQYFDFIKKKTPLIKENLRPNNPTYNYDLIIDEFIRSKLNETCIQIVSEESYSGESLNEYYWLVDPLDGSKGLNSDDDITINIALMRNSFPILGVINNIRTKVQYFGFGSDENYKKTSYKKKIDKSQLRIVISKHHLNKEDSKFIKINNIHMVQKLNSSQKFIQVADKTSDIYIRHEGSSCWDTAAGQAILESQGGKVYQLNNLERLTHENGVRNPKFIAVSRNFSIEDYDIKTKKIIINEINNSCSWQRNST
jgi:3'(2'), 5'-bisphosphate nucleotidase